MIEKIKKLCEETGCSIEYLLKNKYSNPTDLDLMQEERDLPPYAIIYTGKNLSLDDAKYKKKIEFEMENKLEIMCFKLENITSIEEHLDELKSEGYELIDKEKFSEIIQKIDIITISKEHKFVYF